MKHPASVWSDPSFAHESLERLKDDYAHHLKGRAQAVSPGTRKKYLDVLDSFIRFLKTQELDPLVEHLSPTQVNAWVGEQRSRGHSEHGIASRLATLKVFSNRFLFKDLELTTCDLLRKVPRISPPEKPQQGLTEEERELVLGAFDRSTYEDTRNRALVACYMATGLRFKEILELRLDSLDRVRGEFSVRAKGGKDRPARLSPRAHKYLRAYLLERPKCESDRVWVTEVGNPLSYWSGQSVMRRLRERSGIARLHWHLFRHGFAQHALQKGAHPGEVQEMLGHSTATMTRRYMGEVKQQEAARQMSQYSPL